MVDPSSTSFEFLKLLGNKSNLTIITNSINILHEFANSSLNIISTGVRCATAPCRWSAL